MGLLAACRKYAAPTSAVAGKGVRLVRRMGAAARLLLLTQASSAAFVFRRKRNEFAWYIATVLLAAGASLLVTVWLNGA
jgi:hypothetical protein